MYPGVRSQMSEADSQQQKLDLLMEEKSIVSQLFEPDTIDVRYTLYWPQQLFTVESTAVTWFELW